MRMTQNMLSCRKASAAFETMRVDRTWALARAVGEGGRRCQGRCMAKSKSSPLQLSGEAELHRLIFCSFQAVLTFRNVNSFSKHLQDSGWAFGRGVNKPPRLPWACHLSSGLQEVGLEGHMMPNASCYREAHWSRRVGLKLSES